MAPRRRRAAGELTARAARATWPSAACTLGASAITVRRDGFSPQRRVTRLARPAGLRRRRRTRQRSAPRPATPRSRDPARSPPATAVDHASAPARLRSLAPARAPRTATCRPWSASRRPASAPPRGCEVDVWPAHVFEPADAARASARRLPGPAARSRAGAGGCPFAPRSDAGATGHHLAVPAPSGPRADFFRLTRGSCRVIPRGRAVALRLARRWRRRRRRGSAPRRRPGCCRVGERAPWSAPASRRAPVQSASTRAAGRRHGSRTADLRPPLRRAPAAGSDRSASTAVQPSTAPAVGERVLRTRRVGAATPARVDRVDVLRAHLRPPRRDLHTWRARGGLRHRALGLRAPRPAGHRRDRCCLPRFGRLDLQSTCRRAGGRLHARVAGWRSVIHR